MSSLVLSVGGPDPAHAAAGSITDVSVTASNTRAGSTATNVTYAYSFVTASAASPLAKVVVTLPTGTTGTPTLGAAGVSGLGPGSFSATTGSPRTATWTVTSPVAVPAGTVITFAIGGLTNPSAGAATTVATYTSVASTTPLDTGTTNLVVSATPFATAPTWQVDGATATTGASGVDYTYTFTTGSTRVQAITLTLPPGTSGNPQIGAGSTAGGSALGSSDGTLTASYPTLTFTKTGNGKNGTLAANTTVTLVITGLTSTATPGAYASAVATYDSNGGLLNTGTTATVGFSGTLTSATWSAASTLAGDANTTTYTYDFTTQSAATITAVTMSLPTGTTAPGALTTLTHTGLGAGVFSFSTTGPTLTYTLTSPVLVPAGTAVELAVSGIKNTATGNSYQSAIKTLSGISGTTTGTTTDDSATTAAVVLAKALTALSWVTGSQTTSAGPTSYTYKFTTTTGGVRKVSVTLPTGTTGTPTVVTGTGQTSGIVTTGTFSPTSATASTTTLTYSVATAVNANVAVTLVIGGLTNTATPGSYPSTITTYNSLGTVLDTGSTSAVAFAGVLTGPTWSPTSTTVGDTTGYTFGFTTKSASTIGSVTMTLPANTTAPGSLTAGTPTGLGAGSFSLSGTVLTYTVAAPVLVPAGTVVALVANGIKNTASTGSYTSTIKTFAGSTLQDAGTTPAVAFTGALVNPTWATSSAAPGATGVTYTYSFTVATTASLTKLTLTLPTGTSGTPTTTVSGTSGVLAIGSYSPSPITNGGTLTYTFPSTNVTSGTTLTLEVGGLKNTSTQDAYTSTVTTYAGSTAEDSGTTNVVAIGTVPLTGTYWMQSTATASATGVTGTFSFTTPTLATLSSVKITLPAGFTGSAGTPTVSGLPAGTLTHDSTSLTYSFASTSVPAGQVVTIRVPGMSNAPTAGSYQATVTTYQDASTPVSSGTTNSVVIATSALTVLTWSPNDPSAGATGVTYDLSFSTGSGDAPNEITVALPPGTAGSPAIASMSGFQGENIHYTFTSQQLSMSGSTLTITFDGIFLGNGSVVNIELSGMTNTPAAGDFPVQITTYGSGQAGTPLGEVIDSGVSAPASFTGATLTDMTWAAGDLGTSHSAVTYTYNFGVSAAVTVKSVSMSVPTGTGTTGLSVSAATPSQIAGGSVSVSGNVVTYTFPQAFLVNPNVAVSIAIGGFTNTATAAAYTSQVVARDASGQAVAAATSPPVTFSSGSLTNPSWAASSTATGTASTYTYGFTTPAGFASSVKITVPLGTTGTPAVSSISATDQFGSVPVNSPSITRSGTVLTLTWASAGSDGNNWFQEGTAFTVVVTGLVNTTATGSYTAGITTYDSLSPVASASTPAISLSSITVGTAIWTTTDATVSHMGPTYTYSFTLSEGASIASISFTLPPDTPAGTPTLQTVSPSSFGGGALTRVGNVLTYTFTPQTLAANTNMSIPMVVAQNTPDAGTYTSPITVFDANSAVVASGTTTAVTFTSQATALTGVTWTQSTTMTGVSQVHYTWSFTTASQQRLTSVTMTVPAGTGGTPQIVTLTTSPSVTLASPVVALSGTVVTLSFTQIDVAPNTQFTLEVSGMVNTTVPASYSSSVTTTYQGSPRDSGVSPVATLLAPPATTMIWTPSRTVAKAPDVSYTYGFTTVSAPTLTSIVLTVPPGTSPQNSAPTLTTLSPMGLTGATVTLDQNANTLTVSFPSYSLANGTAVSIKVDGLHNSGFVGSFVSTGRLVNSTGTVGTTTAAPVTIEAQKTVLTTQCVAGTSCATSPSGSTSITLIAIPGASAPVVGGVQLSVQSNATFGYVLSAFSSGLLRVGGTETLAFAPGTSPLMPNQFGVTAALTPSGASGAALCPSYGTSGYVAGYATAASAPIWAATSGTGTGSDTVTLTNLLQVSLTQPAGIYTGTISYSLTPNYASVGGC